MLDQVRCEDSNCNSRQDIRQPQKKRCSTSTEDITITVTEELSSLTLLVQAVHFHLLYFDGSERVRASKFLGQKKKKKTTNLQGLK